MQRDNRSAAASASMLEMFSVMLLSALLVGMMISESTGKSFQVALGCGKPNNGCNTTCTLTSSLKKPCAGGCIADAQCKNCECLPKPNEPIVNICWCQ